MLHALPPLLFLLVAVHLHALAIAGGGVLTLVREYKVAECTGASRDFEASGVVARNGKLLIVVDSDRIAVSLDSALGACASGSAQVVKLPSSGGVEEQASDDEGFEAATFFGNSTALFGLEAVKAANHQLTVGSPGADYRAVVYGYDSDLEHRVDTSELSYKFDSSNKGVEGLAVTSFGKFAFLFALCEGNDCKDGGQGKTPGSGTILVYYAPLPAPGAAAPSEWMYNDKIRLPETLSFIDFSGVDVRWQGNNILEIVVTSQESSGLWLGSVAAEVDSGKPAGIDWSVSSTSAVYAFSAQEDSYCNIEGASFLSDPSLHNHVVVVSDRPKSSQPSSCDAKGESVHLFRFA